MANAQALVKAYHERSKHRLQRYAAGPETLDWDAQPAPCRRWAGSPVRLLPLVADGLSGSWAGLHGVVGHDAPGVWPLKLQAVSALLELSFGLTAWKQQGPDRWAVRANPSSGNLHPTEAYVMAQGVAGMADGLYHYAPYEHALVLRQPWEAVAARGPWPSLWIGLSSIQWREAWKYGERAFRYCQLDAGHALGGVRYAASTLGWQARLQPALDHATLAALLGVDRYADFGPAEREEAEMLIRVGPACLSETPADAQAALQAVQACAAAASAAWQGQASRLDAHPMYRWPVIDEVARATRAVAHGTQALAASDAVDLKVVPVVRPMSDDLEGAPSQGTGWRLAPPDALPPRWMVPAADLIRERRSAQHFDKRVQMPAGAFFRLLDAILPAAGLPFDAWPDAPCVHPVLFVHRVEGLTPGAYVLPRSLDGEALLRRHLQTGQAWQSVDEAPQGLPLYRLVAHPTLSGTLRTLSCHQAIASDACFAVSLLAEFDGPVSVSPARYRSLFQESGLLGQVLYMQAEAEGFRGTGIGCYFDDAVHELLGLHGDGLQALYHFTVGAPIVDARIGSEPPYAGRPEVSLSDA